MYYVYRFKDCNDEIIYIGKAKSLKGRMSNHNHLPIECYDEVRKVEYIELSNHSEGSIYEVYLINKFNPKYNKVDKRGDIIGFELPEKEWILLNVDKIVCKKSKVESGGKVQRKSSKMMNNNMNAIRSSKFITIEDFILIITNIEKYKNEGDLYYSYQNDWDESNIDEYDGINFKFKSLEYIGNFFYKGDSKRYFLRDLISKCENPEMLIVATKYDNSVSISFSRNDEFIISSMSYMSEYVISRIWLIINNMGKEVDVEPSNDELFNDYFIDCIYDNYYKKLN